MKQLFEPVIFEEHKTLLWDYKIYTDNYYKGYYHWHQCCEIMFVHRGQGNVVVNQQMYDIRRGMLFFFQPYQLHRIYSEASFERTIFYFDPHVAENLLQGFSKRKALFTALWKGEKPHCALDLNERAETVEWILEHYDHNKKDFLSEDTEDISMLFLQLLSSIEIEDYYELQPRERRNLHYSEKIMSFIEEHYHEEVNLDQLAEEIHLSKSLCLQNLSSRNRRKAC
jgi:hypothetical protein